MDITKTTDSQPCTHFDHACNAFRIVSICVYWMGIHAFLLVLLLRNSRKRRFGRRKWKSMSPQSYNTTTFHDKEFYALTPPFNKKGNWQWSDDNIVVVHCYGENDPFSCFSALLCTTVSLVVNRQRQRHEMQPKFCYLQCMRVILKYLCILGMYIYIIDAY